MKVLRLLLLLCIPSMLLHPIPISSANQQTTFAHQTSNKEILVPRDVAGKITPWGYFDIQNISPTLMEGSRCIDYYFDFLDLLGQEDFLENLSDEELDSIVDFVIWTVQVSVPQSRPDLQEQYEQEIDDLLDFLYGDEVEEKEWSFAIDRGELPSIAPAVCTQKPEFFLCKKKKKKKGWFKRKFHHLGHWCKKHKKPLIIGGVVVVSVGVVVATCGVGASSAVAIGGGLVGAAGDSPSPFNHSDENGFQEDIPPPPSETTASLPEPTFPLDLPPAFESLSTEEVYQAIETEIEGLKIDLTAEVPENPSELDLWEKAKKVSQQFIAHVVHEVAEETGEILAVNPETRESWHQGLDVQFGTNPAPTYNGEDSPIVKGFVPPPGEVGGIVVAAGRAVATGSATTVGAAAVGSALTQPNIAPFQNQGNITVYRSFNPITQEVNYVGITNNVPRRKKEHLRGKNIEIEPIRGLGNLSPYDAHAVEQTLIELHILCKSGGSLINKINSVSKSNPKYAASLRRGLEILKAIEYDGLSGTIE